MIEPKEIEVLDYDGNKVTYVISKMPATVAREVIAKFPVSAMPKIGDYDVNEETMLKIMKHVCYIDSNGNQNPLSTKSLIDNHCRDFHVLSAIEIKMMEYNFNFFTAGKISSVLSQFQTKLPQLIIKTLTGLSEQLSAQNKQR